MPDSVLTIDARERLILAPYAQFSRDTRGRKHAEEEHPYRGPYQRDRDRIVHSAAFRRLADKTQVFTGLSDYHRTRLTHTMEVASIARTVGRTLRLNEDLIEALALVHDIGHPPYGHAGEDVLAELLVDDGGFSHNRYALTLVEELETRSPLYPGLNLRTKCSRVKRRASTNRNRNSDCSKRRSSTRLTASPTTRTIATTRCRWAW
jgi:dGTPase